MKKILFTLMLLLCATAGWAQTYINVATLDELKNALKDPSAKIKLTADIDISSLKDANAPLCSTFSGVIDGSDTKQVGDSTVYYRHKIYGGINTYKTVINEKGEEVKKVTSRPTTTWNRSPLFDKLDNATIKDVAFCNMNVWNESDKKSEIGILASRAVNQCTFTNVVMDYCDVHCYKDRGGVLFGYAENCTFQLVSLKRCVVYVNGVEGGGLVGHSNHCTYEVCTTSFDSGVFTDGTDWLLGYGENAARCGGLVGYSVSDTFTGCINAAVVGADQSQVGGFAGVSKYCTFTDCINVGVVTHIDRSDFTGLLFKRNQKLDDLELSPAVFGGLVGGTTSAVLGIIDIIGMTVSEEFWYYFFISFYRVIDRSWFEPVFINNLFEYPYWEMYTYLYSASDVVGIACATTVILVAIAVGIHIAIEVYSGDDEIGGISGLAQGGTFERCQNYVELKCRDDNCGGIVGLGQGVTINNCFNSADMIQDEEDTTGSILGKAEPDKDKNNKKCKVTNCLSTDAYHIVGDEDYEDGMDPASGNNYRPDREKNNGERVRCEEPVARALINSGQVSWWLNQGVENRSIGAKPWRQGIAENTATYSVMNPNNPEVEIKDLDPYEIDSPEKLYNFSTIVFFNKFAVGVLTADIDMTGWPWIPIGAGEENSFRGIFDGQGHTISGLDCTTDADMGAALFGVVHTGADIRNVTVKNSKFSHANDYGAAGIVGRVSFSWWGNVVIENCASYADVDGKKYAGGILGCVSSEDVPNVNVYVDNCYNGGTITTEDGHSALLCGYVGRSGHIHNSWSAGQLRNGTKKDIWPYSIENPKNPKEAECLVGYAKNLDIQNCYIVNPEANVDQYEKFKDQYPLQEGVTIISDEELANGEFTYKLNGNTNDVTKSLGWQQNLGTDEAPVPGNKGVYHARKVSNEYGTVCLPYPVKSDDKISYYTFAEASEGSEIKLKFERVGEVLPGTPVLFRSAEAKDVASAETPVEVCFNSAGDGLYKYPNSPLYPIWDFLGTFEQKVFTGDEAKSIYYVSNGEIKNAAKTTIAPYRAYITGPSIETLTSTGSGARISIVIDGEEDETSALELVYDYENHNDSRSYTLFGTEAGEGYRGIVIRGGKKVMLNR